MVGYASATGTKNDGFAKQINKRQGLNQRNDLRINNNFISSNPNNHINTDAGDQPKGINQLSSEGPEDDSSDIQSSNNQTEQSDQ